MMEKDVEPEEIEAKQFLISLRGYDREEVDEFLRQVADELRRRLQGGPVASGGATADAYRRVGEETSRILVAAEEIANNMRETARRETEAAVAKARKEAEETREAARKESIETIAAARKEAEETVASARTEAAEILGSARQEATAVEKSIAEAREAAEQDLEALRQARSVLSTQLEDVRRRLDETIARLQAPVDKLPPRREIRLPSVSPTVAQRPEAPPRPREVAVQPEALPVPEPVEAKVEAPEIEPAVQEAIPVPEAPPIVEPDSLEGLLQEIRHEREQARSDVDEALAQAAAITQGTEVAQEAPAETAQPPAPAVFAKRADALGQTPQNAARRLKRLFQEDQNDLLDRLRTLRGKGSFDTDISPETAQIERFSQGLFEILGGSFDSGRSAAGATDASKPDEAVRNLVTRQLIAPLRKELSRVVDAGLESKDTPSAIAERASDVYRVWKGVRTELLGEGLVYSAYHQGLVDVWRQHDAAVKKWIFSTDEDQCPRGMCKSNAEAGPVSLDSAFPSGHLAPPAHGGCTCTLTGPEGG